MTSLPRNEPLPKSRRDGRLVRTARRLGRLIGPSNPLLTRDVLSTMRLRSVKAALIALPLLLALLVLVVAADTQDSVGSAAERGTTLLGVALTAALYVVGLVGAVLGAQSISGERQSKTLDLVLVTGLSPWRIVAGKAAAVWVVLAAMVLACLPPLGACFLVGGVSLTQLLLAAAVPLAVAAVPVAFGVALGTIQGSSRLAVGAAVTFVGLAGPMLFTFAWMGVLAIIGADDVVRHGPSFGLPSGNESLGPLLVGGVVTPLYLIGASTWFLLAASVSALHGRATDRARPLRRWFAVAGPAGGLLITAIAVVRGVHDHEAAVALLGILGAVVTFGALALAAHPAPRRAPRSSTGLPVGGPTGDALFTVIVTTLSLIAPTVALTALTGEVAFFASVIVFAYVVLVSGSGVALASALRPALARWALVGATALSLAMPVLFWIASEILYHGHRGEAEIANVLSPLGALAYLTKPTYSVDAAVPLLGATLWLMIGVSAWILGESRLRAHQRAATAPSPDRAATSPAFRPRPPANR